MNINMNILKTVVNAHKKMQGKGSQINCSFVNCRYYSLRTSNYVDLYGEHLKQVIDNVRYKNLYSGCIYTSMSFMEPYPLSTECEVLTLAYLELFEQYANVIPSSYVKFTIGYTMKLPSIHNEITYTLSNSIPLYDLSGNRISKYLIYSKISDLINLNAEKYDRAGITSVFMRIYYKPEIIPELFELEDLFNIISNVLSNSSDISGEIPEAQSLLYKESRISGKINSIKSRITECRPFIVADIETILIENFHVPYAGGFLVVNPGENLISIPSDSIKTYFSENHIPFYCTFEDRSNRMLFEFLSNLEYQVEKNPRLRTVYFHNFSRGIIILKYYADRKYKLKTLLRNHMLYELKIYLNDKLLLRFRDSCTLLPRSLESLGHTLCPELGSKGSIPHADLNISNLQVNNENLIKTRYYSFRRCYVEGSRD